MSGKGRPTPKRRESQRNKKNPLIPQDRKEAARKARQLAAAQREAARIGYRNGDERYLPLKDKGPQRRFVRDYVDERFFFAQLTVPVLLLVLVFSFIPNITVYLIVQYSFYGIIALFAAEVIVTAIKVKRILRKKFGEVQRGTGFYTGTRMFMMRSLRYPKPQSKRSKRA